MDALETFSQELVNTVWGTPLVALLLGGGCFFYNRLAGTALPLYGPCHRHIKRPIRHPRRQR